MSSRAERRGDSRDARGAASSTENKKKEEELQNLSSKHQMRDLQTLHVRQQPQPPEAPLLAPQQGPPLLDLAPQLGPRQLSNIEEVNEDSWRSGDSMTYFGSSSGGQGQGGRGGGLSEHIENRTQEIMSVIDEGTIGGEGGTQASSAEAAGLGAADDYSEQESTSSSRYRLHNLGGFSSPPAAERSDHYGGGGGSAAGSGPWSHAAQEFDDSEEGGGGREKADGDDRRSAIEESIDRGYDYDNPYTDHEVPILPPMRYEDEEGSAGPYDDDDDDDDDDEEEEEEEEEEEANNDGGNYSETDSWEAARTSSISKSRRATERRDRQLAQHYDAADQQKEPPPHMRLHHMSLDDISYYSSDGGQSQSQHARQSESTVGWETMSRTARQILGDVMGSIKDEASLAERDANDSSRHDGASGDSINTRSKTQSVQTGRSGGMGYGETYEVGYNNNSYNDAYGEGLSVQTGRSERNGYCNDDRSAMGESIDKPGARRLLRLSMDTVDIDKLSEATPMSIPNTAIQLGDDGGVTERSVANSHGHSHGSDTKEGATQQSRRSVLKSLGGSIKDLWTGSYEKRSFLTQDETHPSKESSSRTKASHNSGTPNEYEYGYSSGSEHKLYPLPPEMSPHNEEPILVSKRRSCFAFVYKHMWYFILFTCIVVACIILAAFLTEKNSDDAKSSVDTSSSVGTASFGDQKVGDIRTRTPEEMERRDSIKSRIADLGISDPILLEDTTSPQYYALEWISFVDGAELGPNNDFLPQRYALAVFYLSAKLVEDTGINDGEDNIFQTRDGGNSGDTIGDNVDWNDSENWMGSAGYCLWAGIECISLGGRLKSKYDGNYHITHFNMTKNNILGPFPSELAALGDSLQVLDLSQNMIQGSIPTDICKSFSRLETLALGDNQLTGSLAKEIGGCTSLTSLYLDKNLLSSTIPQSIGELSSLTDLRLGNNRFTGTLPNLEKLENLRKLEVQQNSLTGEIKWDSFHQAANLNELQLQNNQFVGVLPYQMGFLGFLAKLEILYINSNNFSGTIPRAIKNTALRELFVNDNSFSGEMPVELGSLETLAKLHLQQNDFFGSVPSELCELDLEELESDCSKKVECSCCTLCL